MCFSAGTRVLAGTAIRVLLAVAIGVVGRAEEVRFERIGTQGGLSHNSILAILEDRQGFVWLGTPDGLNRYDGQQYVVWRHEPDDPASLSSSHVQALLEDSAGRLWVGSAHGLDRFDRTSGQFIRYLQPESSRAPRPLDVRVLYEDQRGAVWAGCERGLFRYNPGADRFEVFRHDPKDPTSLAAGTVIGIQQDPAGAVWVLTAAWSRPPAVLNRLDDERGRFARFPGPEGWERVGGFMVDRSGAFWLNVSGVGTFDPESGRFAGPVLARGHSAMLCSPLEDRSGRVWMPTDKGFLRFQPETGEAELFSPGLDEEFLSSLATAMTQDRTGTIWFGTRGGLYRWDRQRKPFLHWERLRGVPRSLGGNQVSVVMEDSSGRIWVGSYGGGLSRLDSPDGSFTRYRHQPGNASSLCHDTVWDVAEGRAGVLWLGVESGLCSYDPKTDQFTSHGLDLPSAQRHEPRITGIVEDQNGRLWLASSFGLRHFDPSTGRGGAYAPVGAPGVSGVINFLLSPDGPTLWIGAGLGGQGLGKLDVESGMLTNYPLETDDGTRLQNEGIFHVHRDPSGILWLATSSGLVRFDPVSESFEHYFPREGLPGSMVYSILEDEDGGLWLGTSRGLSRFYPQPGRGSFRSFDLSDGIGSTEFNRHAACRGSDGRFYFGGMEGLTVFRPERIRDNPFIPPVVLTEIRIFARDGASQVDPYGLEELRLSHRQSSFTFRFAALNFTSPEDNRYAFRLGGFDEEWVQAGGRPSARYTGVPPGRYLFRVKGSNNDGLWNEQGVALEVTIAPPFWSTSWFRLLLLALALGAGVAVHRYRAAQLLEAERLRLRIAGDLHDDLSSELSGIALAAGMLRAEERLSEGGRARLAQVEQVAKEMLDGLRDIVWCINPEHDSLSALLRKMRRVASSLLADMDYRFEASVSSRDGVDMVVRRNVYLIFKEALHNLARHSRAEVVVIRLEQRKRTLFLTIADDGAGFDPDRVDSGHGLRGMRRRAEQIGAQLAINSRPGHGTTATLSVRMAKTRDGAAA